MCGQLAVTPLGWNISSEDTAVKRPHLMLEPRVAKVVGVYISGMEIAGGKIRWEGGRHGRHGNVGWAGKVGGDSE